MTYVWPIRLLTPKSQRAWLAGRTLTGGASSSGIVQATDQTGGGLWRTDLNDILVWTDDQFRALRAWSAFLDAGVQQIVVPFWEVRLSPRGYAGGQRICPGEPGPADDYFSWDPGFGTPMISAHITAGAVLRATTLSLQVDVGTPVLGGEHFSINHPTKGWRPYRVATAAAPVSGVQAITIRPPIREALSGGEAAEFDAPRCTMMMDPSKADGLEPILNADGYCTVSASFMEAF